MNQIQQQIPQFGKKIEDLETDYKKVSEYFEDLSVDHEKTFLMVKRNLENEEEHLIGEKEIKVLHPIRTHNCYNEIDLLKDNNLKKSLNFLNKKKSVFHERFQQNQEVPCWVAEKYRLVKLKQQENFFCGKMKISILHLLHLDRRKP